LNLKARTRWVDLSNFLDGVRSVRLADTKRNPDGGFGGDSGGVTLPCHGGFFNNPVTDGIVTASRSMVVTKPGGLMEETMGWILALADDLTGALEVGALFDGAVVTTRLLTSIEPVAPVFVIDTESRHLAPDRAAEVIHDAVVAAQRFRPRLIYKKTDSTLRGNIAAEFRGVLKALPDRTLVYSPAYPRMGRTVKAGELLVHGIPVHQSPFASDTLNPVRGSNIAELLSGVAATIVDGESESDLAAAATFVTQQTPTPIAAGPAGFAAAIAASLHIETPQSRELPRLSRCLVVNGSMHPVSASQIEFARAHGCFDDRWVCFDDAHSGAGLARAEDTGERVRHMLDESRFDAIAVFGGDTAFGIHRALGSHDFYPCGEVVSGSPVSRSGGLVWITKAGGFGSPEVLCDIRKRFT
jgi:uncharacterized protein YgbK (DUF1537 family)